MLQRSLRRPLRAPAELLGEVLFSAARPALYAPHSEADAALYFEGSMRRPLRAPAELFSEVLPEACEEKING